MFGGITVEIPPYQVIDKKNGYEIRRYEKHYLAQMSYEVSKGTDFSSKTGQGFFPLYKYITGNNENQTKISMTAPVIMQEKENESAMTRTMSFIMSPSKFNSLNQLPLANDNHIRIVEESNNQNMACIIYNMTMTTERNNMKEKELRDAAERDGIRLSNKKEDVRYFGYNAPFTIPYFRRNEICIPIID